MALSAKQIGSAASSSVAAATARIGAGGRNVASATRGDVEKLDFNPHLGVNEEQVLRFQQDHGDVNPDGRRNSRDGRGGFTPLLVRAASLAGTHIGAEEGAADSSRPMFLSEVMRAIGTYEGSLRVTSAAEAKPGSVMNYLF